MEKLPKVGIGVIVIRDGKVLLGKRKNAHGSGDWALPGGHLELGESWEECAMREVYEETGLSVSDVIFFTATNDIFEKENKHYITLFMKAKAHDGEVLLKEPEKCEGWRWFDCNQLPEPLFLPLSKIIKRVDFI